jgi:hypothetical protein
MRRNIESRGFREYTLASLRLLRFVHIAFFVHKYRTQQEGRLDFGDVFGGLLFMGRSRRDVGGIFFSGAGSGSQRFNYDDICGD